MMLIPKKRRIPRLGLLGTFAIVSLIPIVLLGLVLAQTVRSQIHERALANARQDAELAARLGIQPLLSPADLSPGLSRSRLEALDGRFRTVLLGKEVARIKIWNRAGRVVYSDNRRIVGRSFPASDELEAALAGRVASEISHLEKAEGDRGYSQLLEVYVPLRFGSEARPAGAFELYLPYAPIAAAIERDTKRLYLVLLGGLILLYGALFRIVGRASGRLRRQATELRRQAEEKEYQALHDSLTDLPNRTLFRDRVGQALLRAKRDGAKVAVLLMDLDRFKEINDTLGHHSGDLLLQELGGRLRTLLRESDTVARLGGDEFALLLPGVADASAAGQVAAAIREALEEPFALQGLTLRVEVSIGIALSPEHGDDADNLIQHADVAMYVAKEARSGHELYTAGARPLLPRSACARGGASPRARGG